LGVMECVGLSALGVCEMDKSKWIGVA